MSVLDVDIGRSKVLYRYAVLLVRLDRGFGRVAGYYATVGAPYTEAGTSNEEAP